MAGPEIEIVLVRPARAANVAAACRALKNMGLSRLTLVGQEPDLAAPGVRALAYGAWELLDAARRAPSLAAALAECTFVASTSARGGPEAWTPRRLAQEAAARAGGGRMAIVFGPEATGLSEDELRLCHALVTIPADAAQPSLNLAQAVLLIAYELRLAAPSVARPEPERATAGELEAALADLRAALLAVGYLNPQNPQSLLAELRRLVARAAPTRRELTLLRGVARQVAWAGQIARGRRPDG